MGYFNQFFGCFDQVIYIGQKRTHLRQPIEIGYFNQSVSTVHACVVYLYEFFQNSEVTQLKVIPQ
jgi:hypothetical protein